MRRLPPANVEQNIRHVLELVPDLSDDILSSVDQPLKSKICPVSTREYLVCDYNREAESYRSPYSNEYDPMISDAYVPSEPLRALEVAANSAFDTYRELYFEGGLSSVYMWELNDGFACVVLIRKQVESEESRGEWHSIHVFEVQERPEKIANYKLTSTIMLNCSIEEMHLSGSITRQQSNDLSCLEPMSHISNLGTMVEQMESRMRDILTQVYFERTLDVVRRLRTNQIPNQDSDIRNELLHRMGGKKLPF